MRDFIVYDGKNLSDFNVFISNAGVYNFPARDVEKKDVPGRNGALIFENNRFGNVEVTYPAIVVDNFDTNIDALVSFLLSRKGYVRIEDTFRPDHFRYGTYTNPEKPSITMDSKAGTFELAFDCKPQLYLKSGEEAITMTASGVLNNPTVTDALPLMRVYSAGSITIGGKTLTISSVDGYVDIDCDVMDAYKGSTNCNANISGDFPVLSSGENTVTLSNISRVDITPRWWTL